MPRSPREHDMTSTRRIRSLVGWWRFLESRSVLSSKRVIISLVFAVKQGT